MKNTGKIIFLLFFLFLFSGLYAVEIETELSPSRIAAGESASLKIRINGKSSGVKPVKFPAVNGLQITFSGSSRSFQFINGKSWSGTVLNFSIYGEKKGNYKIPPFILDAGGEIISSREVSLTVGEAPSGKNANGGDARLRGDVDLSSETVYVGEPFIMSYIIDNGGDDYPHIEGYSERPHVKGFVMKDIDEKTDENGRTSVGLFCLVPVDHGVFEIGGGSVVATVEMTQGFFSMPGRKKILFPYKQIKVLPIPADGKTDNFSGDVGEFKIEAEVPAGGFKLFEEIRIPVTVSGRGNLLTLSKPHIESEEGIKTIIEEKDQALSAGGGTLSGSKKFLITIIPQKEGLLIPGQIFIEFFNPYTKVYERAASTPLSFDVQKGESSALKGEVQFSDDHLKSGGFNFLYAALILLLLGLSIIGLIIWEKKKFRMIKEELRSEMPEEDNAPVVNIRDEVLTNIESSVKDKNSEKFLYNADRGINNIDPEKLNDSQRLKYNSFKDKIYYCRYGGGVFAESEMNELSEWLKKNLKH